MEYLRKKERSAELIYIIKNYRFAYKIFCELFQKKTLNVVYSHEINSLKLIKKSYLKLVEVNKISMHLKLNFIGVYLYL